MEEMQTIPARHGTATFVPKGSTIKIVNTHGTQVIDTWAFALPTPPAQLKDKDQDGGEDKDDDGDEAPKNKQQQQQTKKDEPKAANEKKKEEAPKAKEEKKDAAPPPTPKPKGRKGRGGDLELPTQEEAEAATSQQALQAAEQEAAASSAQNGTPKKGWSSYLPSLGRGGGKTAAATDGEKKENDDKAEKQLQKENSRTWGSYLPSGQGYTSYLPSKGAISAFASSHHRDPNKSYAEQLADFSKTPVGAAGISALSGSGAASSLYAGYSAWSTSNSSKPVMEYLSMPHTRASTTHLIPRVDDVLVSNLREPLLTLTEDTCGVHDTLIAACDPVRYQQLGVEKWEEHGSCAENLVLALKELNERAGLKGNKAIGADVTIHTVPAPLNLFMNIPWTDKGNVKFDEPKAKEGDYVRLRAERDVVVIMSACPQDVLDINAKEPKDGHFVVENPDSEDDDDDGEDAKTKLEKAQKAEKEKKKPRKLNGAGKKPAAPAPAASAAATGAEKTDDKKTDDKKPVDKKSDDKKPEEDKKPAATPAPAKPKAAPKKLTDPNTGEKRKPKKLEKRGSLAPPPPPASSAANDDCDGEKVEVEAEAEADGEEEKEEAKEKKENDGNADGGGDGDGNVRYNDGSDEEDQVTGRNHGDVCVEEIGESAADGSTATGLSISSFLDTGLAMTLGLAVLSPVSLLLLGLDNASAAAAAAAAKSAEDSEDSNAEVPSWDGGEDEND
ncbi:hypothetical protein MBLNU459_g4529t1 [Dothideomycetes sp. NU459]